MSSPFLPNEIVDVICRYNSHPVADIIRTVKQNFIGVCFPYEILFYNKLSFRIKINNIKNNKRKQDKQFDEKINQIYSFVDFCVNSYLILGIFACLLYYVFHVEDYYVLFFICSGYFYFYFISLLFLIYFSMNISTEDLQF